MLGVLKAGAIYVPLDTAGPPARLARMLEVAGCRFILAAGLTGPMLRDTLAAAALDEQPLVGWLDPDVAATAELQPAFTSADVGNYPSGPVRAICSSSDIAHILFTSGSTGEPKGVMITHRSVLQFLRWARSYFGISSGDRASQHPPLHFDLSTFDIYGALSAGAELHLVPADCNLLPHKLAQFMRTSRLTQWFSVPSVLNLMAKFDVVRDGDFPDLRRVMWCGEVMPTPTLIYWMRRLPHARFTNLYGPTEATIASSYYTVPRCPDDEREAVPIGTACAGEELMVLDSGLRPVPRGEIGDLYIRGAGLSPGYWRDAAKTRSAFLPFPGGSGPEDRIYRTGDLARRGAGGVFHFVGRDNTQIKSRGYRIELGEIETALNSLPGLHEGAIVAVRSDGFESWTICCAYVPAPEHDSPPARLREDLARLLPGYMLPMRWLRYDALPRNGNGKVDRPRLRSAFLETTTQDSRAPAAAPATG
jgi:amino acid adenylation domain-containing protein